MSQHISLEEIKKFWPKDAPEIIRSASEIIDPNFDHPWCWHNIGEQNLKAAKHLWNFT